jgi:transcriptional regulator with XRE-family HTH domain
VSSSANEKIRKDFVDRLKTAREKADISQAKLGELAKCGGQGRIANYERGDRWPSIDDILRLAKAVGVSAEFLIFGPSKDRTSKETVVSSSDRELLRQLGALPKSIQKPMRALIANSFASFNERERTVEPDIVLQE